MLTPFHRNCKSKFFKEYHLFWSICCVCLCVGEGSIDSFHRDFLDNIPVPLRYLEKLSKNIMCWGFSCVCLCVGEGSIDSSPK